MRELKTEVRHLKEIATKHAKSDGAGIIPGCVIKLAIAIARQKKEVAEIYNVSVNVTMYWNGVIAALENEQ